MSADGTELIIPEQAYELAVPILAGYMAESDAYDAGSDAIRAAAPLIVAAELDAQAARIEDSANAWGDNPKPGTPAYSMAGVLADVVVELRLRALELRGDRKAVQQ